jgi:hypothetical protein
MVKHYGMAINTLVRTAKCADVDLLLWRTRPSNRKTYEAMRILDMGKAGSNVGFLRDSESKWDRFTLLVP